MIKYEGQGNISNDTKGILLTLVRSEFTGSIVEQVGTGNSPHY